MGVKMVAEKWKDRLTDQLCKAILALETEERFTVS